MEQFQIIKFTNKDFYPSHRLTKKILLALLFLFFGGNIYCQTLSAEQIYEKVKDAVVVILAYDYNNELAAQGSGVVLNDKGYVVTNYHVLSGNERLEIMHGDEVIPYVDIIGIDVEKDILILKIEEKKFSSLKIGDVKKLKVGQRVYAIGSPMGFENSISEGIISGLRSYEESNKNYIQITASISPGSSGGAVVNSKGELIGMSTMTAKEGQNLNFAIPIDEILDVKIGSYKQNEIFKDFELYVKGYNEGEKGNHYEAIKFFTEYINKEPSDANAYVNRGTEYYLLDEYSKALEDYDKAIQLDPKNIVAYNNRGALLSSLENFIGAIRNYTILIEIKPNFVSAYKGRGQAKYYLGDFKGAIKDFNIMIEIDKNNSEAYYLRGYAKYKLDDEYGACSDWSKAGELGYYDAYNMIREYCN